MPLTQLVAVIPLVEWMNGRSNFRLPRGTRSTLRVHRIGDLTLVTLRSDLSASRQAKTLKRAIRQTPLDQRKLVLDVSALPETDRGFFELLDTAINVSTRCRLDLVLAGVSLQRMAYMELTRLANLVTCYERSGDAIQAALQADPTCQLKTA